MDDTTGFDSTLPASLFGSIIPKLVSVLEHTQRSDGAVSPQAKQALLQATNEFKNTLAQARGYAGSLRGGELNSQEQDELIVMLEKLKDHKRQELLQFAQRVEYLSSVSTQDAVAKIEVDSTASTPS
ncbi:hypothetical protein F5I97DRAFT_1641719 [Phlebopus sp. FC_14]|nr:hypothetical protein F5I97DRAFT_1641719 [Phlebopus sp. FC_14]